MPTTNLRADELVTASLRLVRPLGAGGMGTLWIAHHLGLHSDVVVKFISGDLADDPLLLERFQREAAAAAEVRSPHVVQVLDHGVTFDGTPYIAMERLEGEDLATCISRETCLLPEEVAGVISQAARALGRAHERGIIHRDIKPENIFLCDAGDEEAFVKVLDFGIAKMRDWQPLHGTSTGSMVGTPIFMSPEQVMGLKTLDHRSDLWSLGVVAFYAMTGDFPFAGETVGALSLQICNGWLPRPSSFNPALPEAVDAWFQTACAREPAERFPSARAMADALVVAVGGSRLPLARPKPRSLRAQPTAAAVVVAQPTLPEVASKLTELPKTDRIVAGSGTLVSPSRDEVVPQAAVLATETLAPKGSSSRVGLLLAIGGMSALLLGGAWRLVASKGASATPSPVVAAATAAAPVGTIVPTTAATISRVEPSASLVATTSPPPSAAPPSPSRAAPHAAAVAPAAARSENVAPRASAAPKASVSSKPIAATTKPRNPDEPLE